MTQTTTRDTLDRSLPGAARAWLDEALDEAARVADRPAARPAAPPAPWELRFAAAGRVCGAGHADAVRVLLLAEARADASTLTRLYERGTAAERRAVLLALPELDFGGTALVLVEDALRTNDTRLVSAAVGPYAAARLDPHAWRHAVLKCLFTGVPVADVARLAERAAGDAELARMLRDFAAERTAAGRPVPADLHTVLRHADPSSPSATEES
ncbi:EboA domain-containing protein [uncultured Streptomyces sp.]|uniref:EboA domain-containing protein n=1 Tax=uncultured Streptomyces sp. TaxID=174707 RepID=UPI002634FBCD|nr:EboA domain-containing protein [uncultured Streptomyces sp.]